MYTVIDDFPADVDIERVKESVSNFEAKPKGCKKSQHKQENGSKTMSYNNIIPIPAQLLSAPMTADDTEKKQRRYLKERLYEIYSDKKEDARDKFLINEPKGPITLDDFLDRIKNGKFTINDDLKKKLNDPKRAWADPHDITCAIRWRTEDQQPDQDGYDAWKEEFRKKKQATLDIIEVMPVADGLKALQDFEANA